MSELTKKLDVDGKKVTFYTTTEEAGQFGNYGPAIVDGLQAYYALGQADVKDHGSEFKTNLKVKKNNILYYMLTQGIKPFYVYTGLYKMSDLLPESYKTMTQVDIIALDNQNPGLRTNLTKTSDMFKNCASLLSVSQLETSNVKNMQNMFDGCSSLTDIAQLDTSKVENMQNMFRNCSSLPATFPWIIDCTSIKYSYYLNKMFAGTNVTAVTFRTDNDDFNPESNDLTGYERDDLVVTIVWPLTYKIRSIYSDYKTRTNVDINAIKSEHPGLLDNLETTKNMFLECKKLTSISNIDKLNLNNVISMSGMFKKCESLVTAPSISTNKVTDMSFMFDNCKSLTSVPTYNTSNVTNMNSMFSYCTALTTIPLLDTSNVTNMSYMFKSCSKLTSVPNLNTSNVKNMSKMFNGCQSLTSLTLSFDTSKVTDMSSMFDYCPNLTSLDITSFDTSNVTNMGSMFGTIFGFGANKLTTLNLSSFNTSKVTSMQQMFMGSDLLTEITVGSGWNTGNVTNMQQMFEHCLKLTSVPTLNTSKVTTLNRTFSKCECLTTIPQLDTSKATNMKEAFQYCSSLPTTFPWAIDCSSISSASNLQNMFKESSVTKVTLKNVKESIKSGVTSTQLKGDDTLTITFA